MVTDDAPSPACSLRCQAVEIRFAVKRCSDKISFAAKRRSVKISYAAKNRLLKSEVLRNVALRLASVVATIHALGGNWLRPVVLSLYKVIVKLLCAGSL
jgi:hypothetical protein